MNAKVPRHPILLVFSLTAPAMNNPAICNYNPRAPGNRFVISKPPIMKPTLILFLIALFCFVPPSANAQTDAVESISGEELETPAAKKHLNFFVVSRRKKGSLDLASRFNVFRTKLKSVFRRKKFVAIVARDGRQMSAKVRYRLQKFNARIGTIWFDSHGMYKKGYSLFLIGRDEYSYRTMQDTATIAPLMELAPYTDNHTKVIIGSCYGGATYHRPSIDYKDTTRMNGDSLMIAMGKIFTHSSVFASESWVMTKPGLFLKREAVAGYPGRKLFRDLCYRPAWEYAGKWNVYKAKEAVFEAVNPITLDMYGNAIIRSQAFSAKEEVRRDIRRNLDKLEPGLYK